MKRPGPPFGSGPGSDTKLRDVGQRSRTRSDAGRASRSSLSQPNPTAGRSGNSVELLIYLEARGQGRFDAFLANSPIVTASTQPICDAARALHRLGYPDELKLVVWHRGANHEAIRGPLGVWRRLRVREDRGGPRFARWEPFPSRPVAAKKGRGRDKGVGHRPDEKNAPRAAPGAGKAHSLGAVAHAAGGTRSHDGRDHSAKPEEVRRRIERLFPGAYLQLYARRPVPGWTTWGNETARRDFSQTSEAAE